MPQLQFLVAKCRRVSPDTVNAIGFATGGLAMVAGIHPLQFVTPRHTCDSKSLNLT